MKKKKKGRPSVSQFWREQGLGYHRRKSHGLTWKRDIPQEIDPVIKELIEKSGKDRLQISLALTLGSINAPGKNKFYDGLFNSEEEIFQWWIEKRRPYMEFFAKHPNTPGARPNIFLEMEYGLLFNTDRMDEANLALIEGHTLWLPGEKEKVTEWGYVIPKVKPCTAHAHGCPITFPEEPVLSFKNGRWFIRKDAIRCGKRFQKYIDKSFCSPMP